MRLVARIVPYDLALIKPAKTSRNTLTHKKLFILELREGDHIAYGEISPFEGLSVDDRPEFELKLNEVINSINEGNDPREFDLANWPSIRFGLESALRGLAFDSPFTFFDTPFTKGQQAIPINGLIWMAPKEEMLEQIEAKIAQGFNCIKMKVGALDFDEECRLLEAVRKRYSAFQIELRVDANGAFPAADALAMLKDLHRFELHSIEQPIKAGQWDAMAKLCRESKLAIALDEELLGIHPEQEGKAMLTQIRPPYIILKPGLLGGFEISDQWIAEANRVEAGWWVTSALESNIGLNAIAQYTASLQTSLPQGLGTGQLYHNNIASPLEIQAGTLRWNSNLKWELPKSLQG
ncbi:MAG: o-succinylbenzoate synthase [Bacteroidetes bacterium]|nr:MAG: o-succinylbenzoate synthase [Bacteroidota bacterium]